MKTIGKEKLTAYLLNDLPEAEREQVAQALKTSEHCRAHAEQVETTLDQLRGALADAQDAPVALSRARKLAVFEALEQAHAGATGPRPGKPAGKSLLVLMVSAHPRLARAAAVLVLAVGVAWMVITQLEAPYLSMSEKAKIQYGSASTGGQLSGPKMITEDIEITDAPLNKAEALKTIVAPTAASDAYEDLIKKQRPNRQSGSESHAPAPDPGRGTTDNRDGKDIDGLADSIIPSPGDTRLPGARRTLEETGTERHGNTRSRRQTDKPGQPEEADERQVPGGMETPDGGFYAPGKNSDITHGRLGLPETEETVRSGNGRAGTHFSGGKNIDVRRDIVDEDAIASRGHSLVGGTKLENRHEFDANALPPPRPEEPASRPRPADRVPALDDLPVIASLFKEKEEQGELKSPKALDDFLSDQKRGSTPFQAGYGLKRRESGSPAEGTTPPSEIPSLTFEVPPQLGVRFEALRHKGGAGENEPRTGESDAGHKERWRSFFSDMGVDWPAGSTVHYLPEERKLVVANTAENLEKTGKVLEAFKLQSQIEAAAEPLGETLAEARFKAYGVNPVIDTTANPYSTFAIDVDTASFTQARRYLNGGLLPPAEMVRTEEFVNFFDYHYAAPSHQTFRIVAEAAPSRFGRGLHLLKIGVKGRRLGREEQRRAVLTFLVDTSGSMDKESRMGLIRQSLKLLVNQLAPEDQVAIITYGSHARVLLPHTPANEKKRILAALDSLQCGGATNLEEGMRRAYELAASAFVPKGENRVLLLSDGVANLGSGEADAILHSVGQYRRQGITCSVFGFGVGSYDDQMLETLANRGDGQYAYVDGIEEATRLFVDDAAATLKTIATDVKIQVEFDRRRVKRYRQLGYENRQLTKEQFRDDSVDAGEVGSGQSVTALYELELTSEHRQPIGIVRVRYRRIDSGAVEEISHTVTAADIMPRFDKADADFQLAACVAEFAEQLRGSPYATNHTYQDIASVLAPVALARGLDPYTQELLRLVQGAPGMSRGDFE